MGLLQSLTEAVAVDAEDDEEEEGQQYSQQPYPCRYLDDAKLCKHVVAIHLVDDADGFRLSQLVIDGLDELLVVAGIAVFAGLQRELFRLQLLLQV